MTVVIACIYAAFAAVVRRRFDDEGLMLLAAAAAVAFGALVPLLPPFQVEFRDAMRLPVVGMIGGVAAASLGVRWMVARSKEPDLLAEAAVGAAAFGGGFIVGLVAAGMTLIRIA